MVTIESGTGARVSDLIRDVPDRLVSAERELERLCQWDIGSVSLEAKVTLVNCCRLLRASISELLSMLEHANRRTPAIATLRRPHVESYLALRRGLSRSGPSAVRRENEP